MAGAASPEPADSAGYLIVATVRRPHGVRGELQLALETDRPEVVFRPGRVLEVGDPRGRLLGRRLTVTRARPVKDGVLLAVEELTTRDPEVEALRGHSLLIPSAEAAPPREGEVYYRDLIGCEVLVAGEPIGTVHEVMPSGGVELLVVRRRGARELLIPFVREIVRSVDVERRKVEVDPPEGLLDL